MGEAVRRRIDALLDAAERGESSLMPPGEKDRKALLRRGLELTQPLAGQFVRRGTWRRLNPAGRSLWLMRGLAARHPDWRFCEASAAVAYGLPVTWGLLTHVWVTAGRGSHDKSVPGVIRRCVSDPEGPALAQGLPVTSFWRTVFDCLVAFPPPDALAVVDRALRLSQASAHQVVDYLRSAHRGRRGVRGAMRVAALADARAESGGESIARWTMLEAGFEPPELQVWIEDPVEPGTWFRVDFLWLLSDGSTIIGEMDGRQKTERPELMGGRSAVRVLQDERLRESHLSALRPAVVRFGYDVARDPVLLGSLLDSFGVPRRSGDPTDPPPFTTRRAELMQLGGWRVLVTELVAA